MKKILSLIIIFSICVVLVLTFSLMGCKKEAAPAEEAVEEAAPAEEAVEEAAPAEEIGNKYEGVEIILAFQSTPLIDNLNNYLDDFQNNTGIKVIVDLMPYESLVQKVSIDCTTGTKQYDCFWMEPPWLGRFSDEFEPLESYINDPVLGKDFDLEDFSKNFLNNTVMYDGKMLGIPLEACMMVVSYREDVFEDLGIEVPETLDEYIAAAEKIKEGTDIYGVSLMGKRGQPVFYEYMPYMWGFGAQFFDENMHPTLNSPEGIEAVTYMVDLSKYAPPGVASYGWEESATAFLQGEVAMEFLFSDWISALRDPESCKVVGDWNFTAPPGGVDRASPVGTINLGINGDIDQVKKEAAFLFLKWATSKETQMKLAETGTTPVRISVLEDEKFINDPEYRYFEGLKETFEVSRLPMSIPEFFELNDALSIELSAAIAGDKSPKEALDSAQKAWEEIMEKAGYY